MWRCFRHFENRRLRVTQTASRPRKIKPGARSGHPESPLVTDSHGPATPSVTRSRSPGSAQPSWTNPSASARTYARSSSRSSWRSITDALWKLRSWSAPPVLSAAGRGAGRLATPALSPAERQAIRVSQPLTRGSETRRRRRCADSAGSSGCSDPLPGSCALSCRPALRGEGWIAADTTPLR